MPTAARLISSHNITTANRMASLPLSCFDTLLYYTCLTSRPIAILFPPPDRTSGRTAGTRGCIARTRDRKCVPSSFTIVPPCHFILPRCPAARPRGCLPRGTVSKTDLSCSTPRPRCVEPRNSSVDGPNNSVGPPESRAYHSKSSMDPPNRRMERPNSPVSPPPRSKVRSNRRVDHFRSLAEDKNTRKEPAQGRAAAPVGPRCRAASPATFSVERFLFPLCWLLP